MMSSRKVKEKLTFIYHVHKSLNEYIKFSDSKAGILLAASGVLLTLMLRWVQDGRYQGIPLLLYILCSLFLASSFFMFFFSIYPRIKIKRPEGMIFWESILKRKPNEYVKTIHGMDADKILTEVSQDVYDLSRIAHKKYESVEVGMIFLGIALILSVILWFSTL